MQLIKFKNIIFVIFLISIIFLIKLSFSAQIVCINEETMRSGICEIDDIVEIQEDNVELIGAGYNNFKMIQVRGLDKNAVMEVLNGNKVDIKDDPNDLTIKYWYNSGTLTWYKIVNQPKYIFTTEDFTDQDVMDLASDIIASDAKLIILDKTKDKIPLDPNNSIIAEGDV